jgi:hypothetical protein
MPDVSRSQVRLLLAEQLIQLTASGHRLVFDRCTRSRDYSGLSPVRIREHESTFLPHWEQSSTSTRLCHDSRSVGTRLSHWHRIQQTRHPSRAARLARPVPITLLYISNFTSAIYTTLQAATTEIHGPTMAKPTLRSYPATY